MTHTEMNALKQGDKLFHFYLGVCSVVEVIPDRGLVLLPTTAIGMRIARLSFGVEGAILEPSPSRVIPMRFMPTCDDEKE